METFTQQVFNALIVGCVYALLSLGYTMVYGVLNLINFAHGDVLMLGAMVGITILKFLQLVAPGLPGIIKLAIAILGAIPFCVLVNVTIERIAYRPLRNAPRLAPLITAIGVSILLETSAMLFWGRQPVLFPDIMPQEAIGIAGARVSPTQLTLMTLTLVLMLALAYLVEKTRLGRAMRAVAENPEIAGLMGVDANQIAVATFAIGAALAAVAGVMWSAMYCTAHFAMGITPGLKAFTAAVLGGIGNIYGAMLGGLALGFIETFGTIYLADITGNILNSQYQDIFAFIVLILTLRFKPSGLLGKHVGI
jgi:branched-chain amino acid transport system permease protein